MARNKRLELTYVGLGKWFTSDGRFAVLKQMRPIDPMLATMRWKIQYVYSIRSFVDYNGPREWPELAPEIGRVGVYKDVFPWLGKYTGEGSFEMGNPERIEAKPMGGNRIQEARKMRDRLLKNGMGDLDN